MSDYISREALLAKQYEAEGHCGLSTKVVGVRDIEDEPAADVAPVVRGEWVPITNGRDGHECNKCHDYAPSFQNATEYLSKICPNCGARMKETTP